MIQRNTFLATAILLGLVAAGLTACDNQRTSNRTALKKPLELQADGLLVKFKEEYSGNTSTAKDSRNSVLKTIGLKEAGPVGSLAKDWIRVVPTSQKISYLELVKTLSAQPAVDAAEPNYLVYLQAVTPDDTLYSAQWGLNNNLDNASDTDINASEAWSIRSEGKTVVAIIDTGIDYSHVDLKKNIWTNKDEVPNNGIDDDANGYIDDVYGWNFVNNTAETKDDNNHGTHVAGIIGARSNNGIGVAGVNGAARLMSIKVLDKNGQGNMASVIAAIQYAIEKGARISNLSLGADYESKALYDAIAKANTLGHVVVAAAGNYGDDNDQFPLYPANYDLPNVISVAAVNQAGEVAPFSNYGANTVNIGAPGVGIVSTIISTNSSEEFGRAYGVMSGSSCAAPFVAGVLSLAMDVNPNLNAADYKRVVIEGARQLETLSGRIANAAFLNAEATLQYALAAPASKDIVIEINPTTPVVSPAIAEIPVGVALQLSVNGGVPPYTWTIDKPIIGTIDADTQNFVGSQLGEVRITATDSTGVTSPAATVKVVNMVLSPNNIASMLVGEKRSFTVKGGAAPYAWTIMASNGEAGVSVDTADSAKAIVQAKKPGSFRISVNDSSLAGILNIQSGNIVVTGAPLSITIPNNSVVNVGDQIELVATGGDTQYTWKSSNTTIATIDATTGLVKGLRQGTVTITVTDGTGTTDTLALSIVVAPLVITLPATDTLWVGNGGTLQLTANGGLPGYTWSSDNSLIATVNSVGLVTAKGAGIATIRVSDTAGNSSAVSITVKKVAITSSSTSFTVGDSAQLSAIGVGTLSWSITGTAATITNAGVLNALSSGTIQVTVIDANNNSATLPLTINPLAPLSISAVTTEIWVGNSNTLQLSGTGGKAPFTWSITSGSNVVSLNNSTGLVTATAPGTATIKVSDNYGNNSTISVTVKQVALSSSKTTIVAGQTQQLSAVGLGTLSYKSSNTSVATVNSSGVISAISAGNATITLTDANNNNASITIQVDPALTMASPSTTEIWTGTSANSVTLSASGGQGAYTWTSSNTGVATVNSSGVVTAKAEGSTTITVKDGLGVTRTTSITVKSVKITSPTASVSLLAGQTYSFSGQGFGQLSWSTSNSVGSITSNGTNTATFTASSTTTGTVTVSMQDANSNTTINTITVTVNAAGHH